VTGFEQMSYIYARIHAYACMHVSGLKLNKMNLLPL